MRLRNIPGAKEEVGNHPLVIHEPEQFCGRWQQVFGNGNPLYIEVGMGKGRFLMDMALGHPDVNFVGIEMYDSVLLRALQKADELSREGRSFNNCRFLCTDARKLPEIFGEGEVERIYLNFSDPWPKARHDKRRLTSRVFLKRYDKILSEDGILEFKTDNQDLFTFSLGEVPEAGWEVISSTRDLHHDAVLNKSNVMTEYEEKFSSLGHPICKMTIRRNKK